MEEIVRKDALVRKSESNRKYSCPECGETLLDWETRCPKCGHQIHRETETIKYEDKSEFGMPEYRADIP